LDSEEQAKSELNSGLDFGFVVSKDYALMSALGLRTRVSTSDLLSDLA